MSQQRPTRKERRAKAEAERHPSTERVEMEDADAWLADIDAVLEEQAVLTNFRQQPGQ